ncbi:class I SAM-dependent methyltransferase [Nonomuraea sp. K274]|uniref:Class I SAM-dependent methyltransferase n=1 Tax=Nonomuraea cypriaca TaxID=1187855 RepID=A0A931AFJ7_9ACTN|nr:class I SAM-dependent methyltransferase [Nonomuraea cypriaca]MBF8191911.1 class I SAM-dependent methyltransferase [Nonomuraea cypriaca]
MAGRIRYDFMYRVGAPWETSAPRPELAELLAGGEISRPGRALDLGCGDGTQTVFLARQGFETTGVDFSPVALAKAREAAGRAGVEVDLVRADFTADRVDGVRGPYDLIVDYGSLDDAPPARRKVTAAHVAEWTRPGGLVLMWCFYNDIPWWRWERMRYPGRLRPGEERELYEEAFTIRRLAAPAAGSGSACFVLRRRA